MHEAIRAERCVVGVGGKEADQGMGMGMGMKIPESKDRKVIVG